MVDTKSTKLGAPRAAEEVPTSPQTTPVDYGAERDAGHIWNAISGLSHKTGELSSAVLVCNSQLGELRSDLKGLDTGINELKSEQHAVEKSIKVFALIATPLLALAAFLAPYVWTKSMRPDLEKSIADSVKVDLQREAAVKERTLALEKQVSDLEAKLKDKSR